MRIHEWPLSERPRERLQHNGAHVLSHAELIAILLGNGMAGASAVDIARQSLNAMGGLRALLSASFEELSRLHGWGPARTSRLLAAMELSKRHLQETVLSRESLCSPQDTHKFLKARMRDLPYEVFAVVFLDNQHRVIAIEDLFRGTLDSCSVHPREVVKQALKHQAGAVILAHNHPSGVAEPSPADRQITTRLKDALALVEIRTLDHLVIGEGDPVSFAERGWL